MFKVSFVDSVEYGFSKTVKSNVDENGRLVTYVTIQGTMEVPEIVSDTPFNLLNDWMLAHNVHAKNITMYSPIRYVDKWRGNTHCIRLWGVGKAVKAPEDINNPLLAERIAESRAKLHIYRFVRRIIWNTYIHYRNIVFGQLQMTSDNNGYPCDGGLYDIYLKYNAIVNREEEHINRLIEE